MYTSYSFSLFLPEGLVLVPGLPVLAVVKVRGPGGSALPLRFEPPAIV